MAMYDGSMFEMPRASPADSGPSPAAAGGAAGGKGRGRDGREKESFDCTFPGCGQSYSRMEYLKRHQRKHEDVRPFHCKDCNKSFARSDVLLRHRRRCHPTPPPDQAMSPPNTGRTRSYPGVPVSSSRNDSHSRDLSPGAHATLDSHAHLLGQSNSRKHPREESGESLYAAHAYGDERDQDQDDYGGRVTGLREDDRMVRPRYGRDTYDDGSDMYGLRRSMRNELYHPVTGEYYDQSGLGEVGAGDAVGNGNGTGMGDGSGDTSASYTPHLLPIFQHNGSTLHGNGHPQSIHGNGHNQGTSQGPAQGQGQGRHSRNVSGGDPNHLEDASVLLSMAYGLDNDKAPGQSEMGGGDGNRGANPSASMGSASNMSDTGPTQDEITKAALDNTMNNLFGDMSWMANPSGGIAAPSKEQVQSVSDWMSGDMPLIDPALTGMTGSDALPPSNGENATLANGKSNDQAAVSILSKSNDDSSSVTPLSPFPLASLFSPSLFTGLSLPASGGDPTSAFGSASAGSGTASDAFLAAAAAGLGQSGSAGLQGQQDNGDSNVNIHTANGPGAGFGGFNFDFGSPAGIYNTLNTLNMWNASGGGGGGRTGGGSLGPFDTRMFAHQQQNANQQGDVYDGNSSNIGNGGSTAFNIGNSPFNLGNGWLSYTNGNANIHNGNSQTTTGDVFPSNAANQFGFNDAQMSLLEQMAKYHMPQTHVNPNPERPIMRIEHGAMRERQGKQTLAFDARFYLDPDRFSGCYQIPHWKMPPIRTLSLMASRTFDTVLNHFSFVHGPTFKLTDAAACLAFAICTIGGIRNSKQKSDKLLDFNDSDLMKQFGPEEGMDGPVLPEDTWEGMYKTNYSGTLGQGKADGMGGNKVGNTQPLSGLLAGSGTDYNAQGHEQAQDPGPRTKEEMREAEERKLVQEWDAGHTVRNEKTNMLVKSFSLAKGVLMTEYNVALLQALILYHAPYFLSEDDGERACANMFLGTIVNITRQIGFLSEDLEHFETAIRLPTSPQSPPSELNACWRRWIQLETRRRVAYLVYHLDTISSLESNIPCILSSCEMGFMPLPAPDTIWRAPTAQAWLAAVKKYRPMTLDEAMRRIFFLPSFGAFDDMHRQHQDAQQSRARFMGANANINASTAEAGPGAHADGYNLLNEYEYGPFARSAMVLTLLRGVIDIGEGKRDRGDWRDLTDLWSSCSWLRPGKTIFDAEGKDVGEVSRESLRERFALGLQRWRQGWDFDFLCQGRGLGCTYAEWTGVHGPEAGDLGSEKNSSTSGRKVKPPRKLTYCEEALPFFWLAKALVDALSAQPPCAIGTNQLKGVRYNEMLKSARRFTRTGEGAVGCTASASSSHYVSPRDHPTNSSAGAASASASASAGGHQSGMGTNMNGSDTSSVSPTTNLGSGVGLTPDMGMFASWGSDLNFAGLSPASFDSAISAAIAGSRSGFQSTIGGSTAATESTGRRPSTMGVGVGVGVGMGAVQGSGIQLTPPTMAGFASLPVGVGVGIGPGFTVDLSGAGDGGSGGEGWQDGSDFGF